MAVKAPASARAAKIQKHRISGRQMAARPSATSAAIEAHSCGDHADEPRACAAERLGVDAASTCA
jgi:hypothetical protein